MNYMTIIGLERHGRRETARWLRERTVALVREAYERHGALFEFFDASGQRQPPECARKGPVSGVYEIRARYEVIRDYHWTAALCFVLMHPQEFQMYSIELLRGGLRPPAGWHNKPTCLQRRRSQTA